MTSRDSFRTERPDVVLPELHRPGAHGCDMLRQARNDENTRLILMVAPTASQKGRDYFMRNFEYLYVIWLATDANEFRREVEALEFSSQLDDGTLRQLLQLRIPAARLMKLRTTPDDQGLSL